MNKRPLSLTLRQIITASVLSALALIAVGFALAAIFYSSMEKSFDKQLSLNIDALAANIVKANDGKIEISVSPIDPRFSKPLSGYYWQVFEFIDSKSLISGEKSPSLVDENLSLPTNIIDEINSKRGTTLNLNLKHFDEDLRVAARIFTLPDLETPILLIVTRDINEISEASQRFNQVLALSLVMLAIGLVIAVYFQVRLGLSPLTKMRSELTDIREGNKEVLDENIPSELAPIAKELNALLVHNKEVVERARTHVGNLAHALKTPISVMLNESQGHKNPFGELVANQAQTMTRQVEHYLKRARAAARAETLRSRTEVQDVVNDIVRTLQRLYRAEGVRIDIIGETKAVFRGDREDLEDLIGNLTENACKYGGGLVEISFSESENEIDIMIEDDGEGLSEQEAKAALGRGVRLDESAPGSGLGLSIADELARAYGGALDLSSSALGGLKVNLRLPKLNTGN